MEPVTWWGGTFLERYGHVVACVLCFDLTVRGSVGRCRPQVWGLMWGFTPYRSWDFSRLDRTQSLQHRHSSGGCVRLVHETIHSGCKCRAPLVLLATQGDHEQMRTEGAKSEYHRSRLTVKQPPRDQQQVRARRHEQRLCAL